MLLPIAMLVYILRLAGLLGKQSLLNKSDLIVNKYWGNTDNIQGAIHKWDYCK